jgi:hypothetical protein
MRRASTSCFYTELHPEQHLEEPGSWLEALELQSGRPVGEHGATRDTFRSSRYMSEEHGELELLLEQSLHERGARGAGATAGADAT